MADMVRVGLGVLIIKDGKVPLGIRKGSHAEKTWSLPGGHLEFGESFEECAIREAKEETGLDIMPEEVVSVVNEVMYGKHYVTVALKARVKSGELRLTEPERWEKWEWYSLDDLPSPLFLSTKNTIDMYKAGTVIKPIK